MDDSTFIYVLMSTNAVFALVGGLWMAREMTLAKGWQIWKWLLVMWGIYLADGFAFSASMGTNIWSFALAVVWGYVFARWVRGLDRKTAKKVLVRLASYTCLPAVSFLSIFMLMVIRGWPVLTREGGYKFGVPHFIPWPFCTVAGFFAACVGSAVVVKMVVTTVIAYRRIAKQELLMN